MDFPDYAAVFNAVAGGRQHEFVIRVASGIVVKVKHFEIINGFDFLGMDCPPVHAAFFTAFDHHYVGIP